MSSFNRGVYDTDYWYPTNNSSPNDPTTGMNSFQFLASRSAKPVRLGMRWERIQPTLGKVLNSTELSPSGWLVRIKHSHAEPAAHAKALLAVADGHSYTAAARAAKRRSEDAVSNLVRALIGKG